MVHIVFLMTCASSTQHRQHTLVFHSEFLCEGSACVVSMHKAEMVTKIPGIIEGTS